MKSIRILTSFVAVILLMSVFAAPAAAQTFIKDSTCANCHNSVRASLGYNIWTEYNKSGHPYKLNPIIGGTQPTFPANTSPGVTLPPNTSWNDFVYMIGGYGWKARWVKPDGLVYTVGDSAQFNIENASWSPYNKGQTVKYNQSCFKCHTTGGTTMGSWNGVPADSLGTFSQPGIRCEGCHGAGSAHQASPGSVKPPKQGDTLRIHVCGACHSRGSLTNAIPVSGGYIRHHEQLNEMRASKHGDGQGTDLTCASCHDAHIALHYPAAAGMGLSGIKTDCATCHPGKTITVNGTPKSTDCTDCHMAKATSSAIKFTTGNGFKGDVKTHIFAINTAPYPRDSMGVFGATVKLDANGLAKVTLDFACLSCHTDKDLTWASGYATNVHTNQIVTSVVSTQALPKEFSLAQNYPNPFNPSTTIEFSLREAAPVKLNVYDITGKLMGNLIDNMMPAGNHKVTINASDLPSGTYVYEITAGTFKQSKKMVLVK